MLLIKYITGDIHAPFGARTVFKGGGSTTTSSSGIAPEFKPQVKEGLDIATGLLRSQQASPQSIVAGLSPQQQQALAAQQQSAYDKMTGSGLYSTRAAEEAALKNLAGQNLMGASVSGSLGSARSQGAMQGALAGRAGDYQAERQRVADLGVKNLGEVGTTLQKQKQRELQARDESLDRFFNRLTGVASKETTSSGGGK